MKGRRACARGVRRGGREELRVPGGVGRSVGDAYNQDCLHDETVKK